MLQSDTYGLIPIEASYDWGGHMGDLVGLTRVIPPAYLCLKYDLIITIANESFVIVDVVVTL